MGNNKIGIFDSGIGGAMVLTEILKVLPDENYIYYSDSKNNPYGDKNNEEIINICDKIVQHLLEKKCKIIVIACNTATAIAVNYLREKYKNIKFIAIEPAYKMVYDYAYEEPTLIMATKGTIESEKFNLLYNKYNNNKTEILPCVGLADIIEEGNEEIINEYLGKNLKKYKGNIKNVVLGCTHYLIIKNNITKVLGDVRFFDGSKSLALNLKKILITNKIENKEKEKGKIEFIDSQNSAQKKERFLKLLNKEF